MCILTKNMTTFQQSWSCYQNWMSQQRLDLEELDQGLANFPTDQDYLRLIVNKNINHFENYVAARAQLAKHDGPSFFAPSWGTSFENSSLWIGGCRPSLIIRLVYVLCGSHQSDQQLAHFLEGVGRGNLGDISGSQLNNIDALHAKTVREEDKLTSILASLQERVADEPLALLAYNCTKVGETNQGEVVDKAMENHALDMYKILMEADHLRLDILKQMMDILTPLQAVEFLVASKKLQLSLHEWSISRDIQKRTAQPLRKNSPSSSGGEPPEP